MNYDEGAYNFIKTFVEFDNHIFKKSQDTGQTFFGQFFITNL